MRGRSQPSTRARVLDPLSHDERRGLLGRTRITCPEDRAIWQRVFGATRAIASAVTASDAAWRAVADAQRARRQITIPGIAPAPATRPVIVKAPAPVVELSDPLPAQQLSLAGIL